MIKNKSEKKRGISWGVKVFVINALFVLLILGLVYYSTTLEVNLVTDNYYEQELKYQDQIDKSDRSKSLPEKMNIYLSNNYIRLKFPELGDITHFGGNITCYRPSDHKMDITVPVSLSRNFEQVIPVANLQKGLWKVKADWNFSGVSYFDEKPIMVE